MNKLQIIGRLGAEPELRYTADGKPICSLRVATTETWKGANGELKEHTEWHRCVLNNRLAEIAGEYLHKGDRVYLEGKIRTRKWQDKNGQDRYTTELRVDEMEMLSERKSSDKSPPRNADNAAPASPSISDSPPVGSDNWYNDAPF